MKAVDLSGLTYGKWSVISRSKRRSYWLCECECGVRKEVFHGHLKSGASASCGCFTHDAKHPLYSVWNAMKVRCIGSTAHKYKDYGGRGIGVCNEWAGSFHSFKDWALSSGWVEGLTIERKDVDGDYSPENCTWLPKQEQNYNKRNTLLVEWNGSQVSLAWLIHQHGQPYQRVIKRLERGWSLDKALTEGAKINQYA